MNLNQIFDDLWNDYTTFIPSARKILEIFTHEGVRGIANDYIAFRTLDDPRINIDVLADPFVRKGYVPVGEYTFKDKLIRAKHYEIPGNNNTPRIFISEMVLEEVSPVLRDTFIRLIDDVALKIMSYDNLVFSGSIFDPLSFEIYSNLKKESEYAAWFYIFGFRANHFTLSMNSLRNGSSPEKVNQLLIENGFVLNTENSTIKGSSHNMLRHNGTVADIVRIRFNEGDLDIPCCYYEFAVRHTHPNGKLFTGIETKPAEKIWVSTDNYQIK